jgi:uncharacterized protein (UPF0305 family)
MTAAFIEQLFSNFLESIATIKQSQRITEQATKNMLHSLYEQHNIISKLKDEGANLPSESVNVFSFYSPYTGELLSFNIKRLSIEESAKQVHFIKNKQYQWLLVEAFELFEDFIISAYQVVQNLKPDLRLKKDLGNMSRRELKKIVMSIFSHFREIFPEIKKMEADNKLNKNLRLHLNMIEKFRHLIVHKNGKTDNPEESADEILKRSCLLSDKAKAPEARATIENYLDFNENRGLIVLVEKQIFHDAGLSMQINRLEILVDVLISEALILAARLLEFPELKNAEAGRGVYPRP